MRILDRRARAAGLVAGVVLDAVFADPRHPAHPVAAFGRAAAAVERRLYRRSVARGALHAGLCVGTVALLGVAAERATRGRPAARAAVTAAATWAVLGGTTLAREGAAMAAALRAGDLAAARERLPHLCGRDPSALGPAGLARATVESIAENTSDAVVAPLLWGALAGVPGLLAYRAVNTLDAMVGHRSDRYLLFGRPAARLDDLANFLPARLTGVLACALAPVAGGSPRAAWEALRRYGHRHPSPNAGRCEAAFAGALGVRLGGRNVYGGRVEHRPELGDGPPPAVADIARSVRLARAVNAAAAVLTAAAVLFLPGLGRIGRVTRRNAVGDMVR
ncbi:cobalamin biosynthesis protein CobD [Sphaerisporangium rufum]|uniref:Cobalamin biosynthesis protein CobD n=1 Tax=Sphaerisporangium rufum TaxID=1381558 RepID=A0A919R3U7_9ACTN|nr:cobalamin biosynthesis protein [Sphaerisporangium rufum]GII79069.1 cobalamin biosynthesis protein CobD [Sphaerisporangium rufum]